MFKKSAVLIAAALTFAACAPAHADYFVWEDAKSGVSLSYPDTWLMVNARQPDEVLTITGPMTGGENDDAVCRVRVRDDKRFVVYPPHLGHDVQAISYNEDFLKEYLNEYDDVTIYANSDASLGRGFGSFAVAGYDGAMFTPKDHRRGVLSASLYFDKAYIVDCSSRAKSFEKWMPIFLSIIGSVDFKKTHDEVWSGDYRNFFADPRIIFKWPGSDAFMTY